MKSHETQHINVSVAKPTPKKEYNRVTCDMCGVLLFENNLKQHILTEHTHETHKCDLCDYTANTKLKVRICLGGWTSKWIDKVFYPWIFSIYSFDFYKWWIGQRFLKCPAMGLEVVPSHLTDPQVASGITANY